MRTKSAKWRLTRMALAPPRGRQAVSSSAHSLWWLTDSIHWLPVYVLRCRYTSLWSFHNAPPRESDLRSWGPKGSTVRSERRGCGEGVVSGTWMRKELHLHSINLKPGTSWWTQAMTRNRPAAPAIRHQEPRGHPISHSVSAGLLRCHLCALWLQSDSRYQACHKITSNVLLRNHFNTITQF